MIKELAISNYKMFDNFKIEFSDGINLVCGLNGSGKSSILEVLDKLSRFLAMPDYSDHTAISVEEAFPFSSFCRWKQKNEGYGDLEIALIVQNDENNEELTYRYYLCIRYNFLDRRFRVEKESLTCSTSNNNPIIEANEGNIVVLTDDFKTVKFNGDWSMSGVVMGSRNNSKIRKFGEIVSNITNLQILPLYVRQDFSPIPPVKRLDRYGKNFPAWRNNNANEYNEKQSKISDACRYFIPGLISINDRAVGDLRRLIVRVRYKNKEYELSFEELSDGQKKLIILHSLIVYAEQSSTLVIDEPENYLSPTELQPLLDAMHDAWEEKNTQFVIISHNPKTLNWYHNEATILSVEGTPPHIVARPNDDNQSLVDTLIEMEWEE